MKYKKTSLSGWSHQLRSLVDEPSSLHVILGDAFTQSKLYVSEVRLAVQFDGREEADGRVSLICEAA